MTTQLRGTMLVPGVSANRRLYTPEAIRKAYDKLSERIKQGTNPVTMLTHHAAEDNSVKIVGRITSVSLDDGKLNYTAELADTAEAATIDKLVNRKDGQQFLRGVSIRGWWCGDPTTKMVEGVQVTTADDMEIDGLDFTKTPGVTGAFVVPVESKAAESGQVHALITESVETRAVFSEAVNKKPYGSVRYADPGYQSDKVKRYPLDTKAHAKAAWSYINQADNQKLYSAAQLKRIRARIKSALSKFGVNVAEDADMPQALTEAATTISEYYAVDDSDGRAGFCISAYNGPLTVSVSAYSGVDPADLSDIAMAAMKAACDAIHALDPDDDGDIDVNGEETNPDDNQMETAPASATEEAEVNETTTEETAPEAPAAEETAPAEETVVETTAEETPAATEEAAPLTRADLEAAVAAAVSAALQAPRESAEAAPEEAAALRETIRLEVLEEAAKNGVITRKGLVVKENSEPEKPLHEMNDEEFRAYQQERSQLFFTRSVE